MKLADIANGPWAITPSMLDEIHSIYATHLRGDKIDLKGVEARIGAPLMGGEQKPYDVVNGIAIIPIQGVISQKMNLMSQISGGASSQLIARDFQAALNNPQIKGVILDINSPGGTVSGTAELAQIIADAKGKKPVCAITDGQMCSAAYWIGSAADVIYITSDTTSVGSIGVITKHQDISQAEAAGGVVTTVLSAGKYKATGSPHGPLTTADKQIMQDGLDYLYSAFVDGVAANRGTDSQTVIENMAEGRVFIGKQAIAAGLVDGVSTIEALIGQMSSTGTSPQSNQNALAGVASAKGQIMDITMLKEQHPDLCAALLAEGQAIGAVTERARILAIQESALPGHDAIVAQAIADGTSAGDTAGKILSAEKSKLAAVAESFAAGGAEAVQVADPTEAASADTQRAEIVAAGVAAANAKH